MSRCALHAHREARLRIGHCYSYLHTFLPYPLSRQSSRRTHAARLGSVELLDGPRNMATLFSPVGYDIGSRETSEGTSSIGLRSVRAQSDYILTLRCARPRTSSLWTGMLYACCGLACRTGCRYHAVYRHPSSDPRNWYVLRTIGSTSAGYQHCL